MVKIITDNEGYSFETVGLFSRLGYELMVSISDKNYRKECHEVVEFLTDLSLKEPLESGETIFYGCWGLIPLFDDVRHMGIVERDLDGDFRWGTDNTVKFWRGQKQTCAELDSEFRPPCGDQLVVISEGVYEGQDAEGVRYPSPDHMSGWWITTDSYNNDVSSLVTVHAYQLVAKRPELAKYLALPCGFRFFPSGDVYYDAAVLEDE